MKKTFYLTFLSSIGEDKVRSFISKWIELYPRDTIELVQVPLGQNTTLQICVLDSGIWDMNTCKNKVLRSLGWTEHGLDSSISRELPKGAHHKVRDLEAA